MHPRYPAPIASDLWSPQSRANRMRDISDRYAIDAIEQGLLGGHELSDCDRWKKEILEAPLVSVDMWRDFEKGHGHEIVGFLAAYLDRLPDETHKFVHYGLTSSDLVEFDLHLAIADHANALVYIHLERIKDTLADRAMAYTSFSRAGRTHGQTAEMTDLGHQFKVFRTTLQRLIYDLRRWTDSTLIKSPGPTGNSHLRRSQGLGGTTTRESTQILPRDILSGWAADYTRVAAFLESLAMFIRLGARSEIGEFQEGAAAGRQGSSAMPGKHNPIDCEKVCGLARLARGYNLAISEVQGALWEDRDLSNSSTERVAVPDLAATVEHMAMTMVVVLRDLVINEKRITANASVWATRANHRQNEIQRTLGVGPIEASKLASEQENDHK